MGMQPAWLGLYPQQGCRCLTKSLKDVGGTVHRAPDDIPASAALPSSPIRKVPPSCSCSRTSPTSRRCRPPHPAIVSWHEPYTSDWRPRSIFYSGQFRLDQCRRIRHGAADGHLPDLFGRCGIRRRHHEQAAADPGAGLAILFQRRLHRRGRQARHRQWWQGADGSYGSAERQLDRAVARIRKAHISR